MQNNSIGKVWKLIERRFRDQGFCVKEICGETGMSMSALHEFLSVKCGMTPHLLIETRRLIEALSLMRGDGLRKRAMIVIASIVFLAVSFLNTQYKLGSRSETTLPDLTKLFVPTAVAQYQCSGQASPCAVLMIYNSDTGQYDVYVLAWMYYNV